MPAKRALRRACVSCISVALTLVITLSGVLCGPLAEARLGGERKQPPMHSLSIADESGAMLEQHIGSRVDVTGMRFPARLSEADSASFEFETTDTKGLLFHADSDDGRHEITAWIDGGAVKVRLTGWCLWLKLGEVLWDDINVSDGKVHKFSIKSRRNGGIKFHVDDRDELAFFHTSRAVFSCWHVDNFYFGGPGPKRFYAENNSDSEYSYKMSSCIKNFSFNATTSTPKMAYYRVSSCPKKGFAVAPRHQRVHPTQPQQLKHPRAPGGATTTTTTMRTTAVTSSETGH